jgi:hypothetical protein
MRRANLSICLSTIFLLTLSTVFAQDVQVPAQVPVPEKKVRTFQPHKKPIPLEDPTSPRTLNEQYRYLMSDYDLVEGFRVLKTYKFDPLWKSVQDSIRKKKNELVQLQLLTQKQSNEIADLKTSLGKSDTEKSALTTQVDTISVFGIEYSKSGFKTLIAFVTIGLIVLSVVFFLMYRLAFGNAHEFRQLNESLYKEFEDYKHHTIEKEIKITRELQNYRNRLAELKSA